MTGSFRLLILVPADPVPAWVSGLSQRLSQFLISAEYHTALPSEQMQYQAILNLTSESLQTSIPVITHNLPDLFQRPVSQKLTRIYNDKERVYNLHVYLLFRDKEYLMNSGEYRTVLHNLSRMQQDATINLIILLETSIRQFAAGFHAHFREVVIKNEHNLPVIKPVVRSDFKERLKKLFFRDHWLCAVTNISIHQLALEKKAFSAEMLTGNDRNVIRADPFGCLVKGEPLVLYERVQPGKKGEIACLYKGNEITLLKKPGHFSFPFLFRDSERIYCIPEQHSMNRVDLYILNTDKLSLESETTILNDVSLADVTLIRRGERYWMFCTDNSGNGANLRLLIFFSSGITGEWVPHPLNPVKTSISGSRSGGTLFEHNGQLYRPAQNCSHAYGGSVKIFRVVKLSETEFEEEEVNEVFPSQFGTRFEGIHTISAMEGRTLIDLKIKIFTLRNLFGLFRKKRVPDA